MTIHAKMIKNVFATIDENKAVSAWELEVKAANDFADELAQLSDRAIEDLNNDIDSFMFTKGPEGKFLTKFYETKNFSAIIGFSDNGESHMTAAFEPSEKDGAVAFLKQSTSRNFEMALHDAIKRVGLRNNFDALVISAPKWSVNYKDSVI